MEDLLASKDKHCHVCGDIGVSDTLITCSRCKVSREHIYCMRICRDYPPEDWCCEGCEHKNRIVSPTSGGDLPKASSSNCSRRLQFDSAQPNRIPDDLRRNCMDREKKFQTRKVKPLSPQEVIMLNSRAKRLTSSLKVSSRPSTYSPRAQH